MRHPLPDTSRISDDVARLTVRLARLNVRIRRTSAALRDAIDALTLRESARLSRLELPETDEATAAEAHD